MRKPDRSAADITKKHRFTFSPFRPKGDGKKLRDLKLPDDDELLVFERGGQRRALLLRQMAYHHAAQGELAGQPYLISF